MFDLTAFQGNIAFDFMLIALIVIFGPLLAERLRLPGILGLLVGGALVGPSMTGLLANTNTLQATGDIGVLYLIFLSGLQLDLEIFLRNWRAAMGFGLTTAFIPLVLGILAARFLGFEWNAAVLIGSFWASFTLIAYPVVKEYGLIKNPAMAATVGASSITDTISLIILAFIAGLETGDQRGVALLLNIVMGLGLTGLYTMVLLPWAAHWFFAGMGHARQLRFMFVLLGLMSSAVVAELLGIEPLIGAFFAGLGLNRAVPNESALMERTDFFGNALFIPAFMVSVGLLFDPEVLFTASTIRIGIFFSAALLAGKAIAAWLTGRMFQFGRAEVGLMFSISVAQAAATLAATIIGLELGLYDEVVVNAVILVIVVSLVVTSIGANLFAPRIPATVDSQRRLGETILVPITGQEPALAPLLALGGQIAQSSGGLLSPLVIAIADDRGDAVAAKRALLAQINETIYSLGLTGDAQLRVDHSVAGGVSRAAVEQEASLVLLNWPGPQDVRSYLLGANDDAIAAAANVPVASAMLQAESFDRIVLVVYPHNLAQVRREDLVVASEAAIALSGRSKPLHVGPVEPSQLMEAGIVLPENVVHLPAASNVDQWTSETLQESDLLVLPTRGRPFTGLGGTLSQSGHSVVVVAARPARSWYGTDNSLGIPRVRTSPIEVAPFAR